MPLNLRSAREQADRRAIRHALARSEGNISSTATTARDQPADALRPDQAVRLACLTRARPWPRGGADAGAARIGGAGATARSQTAHEALARGDGIAAEEALKQALAQGAPRPRRRPRPWARPNCLQGDLAEAREWLGAGRIRARPSASTDSTSSPRRNGRRRPVRPPAAAFDKALAVGVGTRQCGSTSAACASQRPARARARRGRQRAKLDPEDPRATEFRGRPARERKSLRRPPRGSARGLEDNRTTSACWANTPRRSANSAAQAC